MFRRRLKIILTAVRSPTLPTCKMMYLLETRWPSLVRLWLVPLSSCGEEGPAARDGLNCDKVVSMARCNDSVVFICSAVTNINAAENADTAFTTNITCTVTINITTKSGNFVTAKIN